MSAHECLLEVGGEPNPLFHFLATKQVLTLLDQFVSTHLHVLVKQIAAQYLFPVLVVKLIAHNEQKTESGFSYELHILVVEEQVIVIEE